MKDNSQMITEKREKNKDVKPKSHINIYAVASESPEKRVLILTLTLNFCNRFQTRINDRIVLEETHPLSKDSKYIISKSIGFFTYED